MPSYAFNRSGSPPVDHRSRLGGPCNIPLILLTLCECSPKRLPCLVEYLKATQQFPRPDPRFTSYLYKVYETIEPLVTTWLTIWAKVIVIVATYRRVVTSRGNGIMVSDFLTPGGRLRVPEGKTVILDPEYAMQDGSPKRLDSNLASCSILYGGDRWWDGDQLVDQVSKLVIPIFEVAFPG